ASYLLSRTLVPPLARLLLEKEDLEHHGPGFSARFNRWRDEKFARFQEAYGRGLTSVLASRGLVLGAAGLVVVVSAALPFLIGLDFFPSVDAGQMRLHFRAPIGTRLEETERLVARLEARIDVQIDGPDVDRSFGVARDLAARIRRIPGASDVRIPQILAYPALAIDVDRARAAQIGITERDVANNLLVTLSSSSLVSPSF